MIRYCLLIISDKKVLFSIMENRAFFIVQVTLAELCVKKIVLTFPK